MSPGGPPTAPSPGPGPRPQAPAAIAIGASAGGPKALQTILAHLPPRLPAYLFLVQHIHPKFTAILARRLAEVSRVPVQVAADGTRVEMGRAYLAPGNHHMVLTRGRAGVIHIRLHQDSPSHGVRPAVDYLFASLAEAFGPRSIAVVLTGMGRDGLEGARAVKGRGGIVLAEAPESAVVYGMPRALVEAAVADRVVPLAGMAATILEVLAGRRRVRPGTAGKPTGSPAR